MRKKDTKTSDIFNEQLDISEITLRTVDGCIDGLEQIAKHDLTKPAEKIKAISEAAKMQGFYAPKKVDLKESVKLYLTQLDEKL